jgi:signal transduction histidine kinase
VDLAALRERNRLAREMHDSLGHALVSIAIKAWRGRLRGWHQLVTQKLAGGVARQRV